MATKKTAKKSKFTFKSENKYICVEGNQFLKGIFETDSEEVAEILRKYPQIEED